jgi:hypothetical protein
VRILFYLPAVTANWFADTVVHLIRAAARDHEVHVLVPPMWSGTGITEGQLHSCADLDQVRWHILNGADHPSYRTQPESADDLVAFVRQIDPAITICRSADVETPQRFPGTVRFLTEAEFAPTLFAPVPRGGRVMLSGPRLFDFGFVPTLTADERDWLTRAVAPRWDAYRARNPVAPPSARRVVALPLQYQGTDNFFGRVHGDPQPADAFVATVAETLGEAFTLAVSVHPIDKRQGTGRAVIERIAAMDPARVRIVRGSSDRYQGEETELLIRDSDALVVAESKAIAIGAFYGKPVLRRSRYDAAGWVDAYADVAEFRDELLAGTARAADPAAAMIWYAYHYANYAFTAARIDFAELIARVERPHDAARWERALAEP